MKSMILEMIEPLCDFYVMRRKKKREFVVFWIFPIIVGVCLLCVEMNLDTIRTIDIDEFTLDLLNQLITVLTLFISFSMAYLSIIITSDSQSIKTMKETNSKEYSFQNSPCTVFQVLMADLTYTLVIEVIFLLLIFFQKFLIYMCSNFGLKILIALNIVLVMHVLILMLLIAKNIYFSFWKG